MKSAATLDLASWSSTPLSRQVLVNRTGTDEMCLPCLPGVLLESLAYTADPKSLHDRLDFTSNNTQLPQPISAPIGGVGVASETSAGVHMAARSESAAATASLQLIAASEGTSALARYIEAASSTATRRAYRGDLDDFLRWGGHVPCTQGNISAYIADRAQIHSPFTVARRVVGISRAHTSQGFPDPAKTDLVRAVLRGVRRTHGKPQRRAAPLLREDVLALLDTLQGKKGIRDRALILVGFAAALRRSELVGLDVEHLEFVKEGMLVQLLRSKTDQDGTGRKIAVPYGRTVACPVMAVKNWLDVAAIQTGPVFRSVNKSGRVAPQRLSAEAVSLIVKAGTKSLGLPAETYSGHSLRAGLVTSAAKAGVSIFKIQEQTGHRSQSMLMRYIRDANAFEDNASGLLL